MILMLDTHVLVWWLVDDPRLGAKARMLIADPDHAVLISIASPWEMAVKHRIGKFDMAGSAVMRAALSQGVEVVALHAGDLATLETLALHHRDPFDHLIAAQALVEDAVLVTADRIMARYGVRCIPA